MNISGLFIRRPIMTSLVVSAILLFGILGYRQLPVSDLPSVDFPTISVFANVPGASPETMAAAVATPLEKQFSTIPGVSSMTSSSSQGFTNVTLQFDLNRNIDAAAQDVQSAIAQTSHQLPANMPSPPSYRKVNPADSPVIYLVVSSPTLKMSDVDEYAETLIAQRISTINGVAQVQVYGQAKYAVRVQLDPRELASRGIGINEVQSAIQSGNVNLPVGTLIGPYRSETLQANGQLADAAAYRKLIVAYRNGAPVRLDELGNVLDSVENDQSSGWFAMAGQKNPAPAIILPVQRQPGSNTVDVVDAIKAALPAIQAELPPAVSLQVLSDKSVPIRDSFNDVKNTLMLTMFLVIMVIFLFLRNVSATIIPSLALPFSIVGTFAVMYMLNYSLDNMSLMALTLSVGFVVDDAIVMLENIVRHMEHGEGAMEAALKGSREIGFTIVSMTLSLSAVFIPVLFMGGILGRLLHEFAVTIASAILVSGFVSLTLTPMLCSRLLRNPETQRHGWMYRTIERGFQAMLHFYEWSLRIVVRHRLATMGVAAAILVATGYLFVAIPKGFLPSEDTGLITAQTQAMQGISPQAMAAHQEEVNRIILADPNVDNFNSSTFGGGNTGHIGIHLKDRSQRALSADEVIQELRQKLSHVPGINVFLSNPPPIRIGGYRTNAAYQLALQSPDLQELYQYTPILVGKLSKLPNLQDVNSDLQLTNPQVNVQIDRDKASSLGVTPGQIEQALAAGYSQQQVSTIFTPTDQFHVVMELEKQYQRDPSALSMLYIRSTTGQLVPLNAVASITRSVGPSTVQHLGQLPAVTVSFNLAPGASLGTAVSDVSRIAAETLPSTMNVSFQGTAQAFQDSLKGLGLLLVMAILVIYLVLGILYESLVHPLTILSGLPAAGFGALLTLMVFHMELDLYAFVGVIMLVGLVKKNAIMMIDFALEAQRTEGKSPQEAIVEGSLVRFRPIMMTTFAALMGTLPIALGLGAGSESRRPLGVAVVGGLLFSQLLTLYITPVFYTYMESISSAVRWLRRRDRTKIRQTTDVDLGVPEHSQARITTRG
ncbi:MAG: efflux RND transporter permease subunit [Acidobacteriota bacterium]|nr:efflux RND transporter permease subunit [Acidobacteriota bacterium]